MWKNKEKIFLLVYVLSIIALIFSIMYITFNCPRCSETYNKNQPVIVYKIGVKNRH
jgi:transposase-like protein